MPFSPTRPDDQDVCPSWSYLPVFPHIHLNIVLSITCPDVFKDCNCNSTASSGSLLHIPNTLCVEKKMPLHLF